MLDAAQGSCIAVSRRKRALYSYFEAITNGDTPPALEPRTGASTIISTSPRPVAEPAPNAGTHTDSGSKWNVEADMLNDEPELEEADLEEGSELPVNDLLSSPEQFDEPYADWGSIIDENLG